MVERYSLTRKQNEVFIFLQKNRFQFEEPPTLDELCQAMGLKSRGSLHKHIRALIAEGLVEAPNRKQRGIRLTEQALAGQQENRGNENQLPFVGAIAAGKPIEAIENIDYMSVPDELRTGNPCFILQVKGDSMVEEGILDGDWVVVEQRSYASNGEIVVALIDKTESTLKFIEQYPQKIMLIPANSSMESMAFRPEQVEIQGVLVGQMRSYINH